MLRILRCIISARNVDWEFALPLAEFGVNSAPSPLDGLSPFERDLGYCPTLGLIDLPEAHNEMRSAPARELSDKLEDIASLIIDARIDAALRQKEQADTNRAEEIYRLGDRVWLSTRFLRPHSSKLDVRWIGPFTIVEVLDHHAYRLDLKDRFSRLHPVFDGSQLKRWNGPDTDGPQPSLLWEADKTDLPNLRAKLAGHVPVAANPDKAVPLQALAAPKRRSRRRWEVDAIRNHRVDDGTIQFLVHWLGYSEAEDTWEPLAVLDRCDETVVRYLANLKESEARHIENMVPTKFKPASWADYSISVSLAHSL